MAKAVKKSPTQKSIAGKQTKSIAGKKSSNKSPKQTKDSPKSARQRSTNKRNQKSESIIPKARSTQSILKREWAQKSNQPTTNRRPATKNSSAGDGGNRKTTPKASESVKKSSNFSEQNSSTDVLPKIKHEQHSKATNSNGDKSPSFFDQASMPAIYRELDFAQKPDSTVLSSDSLVNGLNSVAINSVGQTSPDLFDTELIDGPRCSENTSGIEKKEKVEMVEVSVQCKLSLEHQTDAQVQVGTGDTRVKMIDIGIQTSSVVCENCQTEKKYGVDDVDDFGGHGNDSENPLTNFDDLFHSNDDCISYVSDSSYDHCLDDFDCLEHLDNNDNADDSAYQTDATNDIAGRETWKIDGNQRKLMIGESPPRNLLYKNDGFYSPESIKLGTTKKTHR